MSDDKTKLMETLQAFSDGLCELNMDPEKVTIVVGHDDGIRLEFILSSLEQMIVTDSMDQRASSPKADRTIREFRILGMRIQYRPKLYKMSSGEIR